MFSHFWLKWWFVLILLITLVCLLFCSKKGRVCSCSACNECFVKRPDNGRQPSVNSLSWMSKTQILWVFSTDSGVDQMRSGRCFVSAFPSNWYSNTPTLFAGHESRNLSDLDDGGFDYTHRKDLVWFMAASEAISLISQPSYYLLMGTRVTLHLFPFCLNTWLQKMIELRMFHR